MLNSSSAKSFQSAQKQLNSCAPGVMLLQLTQREYTKQYTHQQQVTHTMQVKGSNMHSECARNVKYVNCIICNGA